MKWPEPRNKHIKEDLSRAQKNSVEARKFLDKTTPTLDLTPEEKDRMRRRSSRVMGSIAFLQLGAMLGIGYAVSSALDSEPKEATIAGWGASVNHLSDGAAPDNEGFTAEQYDMNGGDYVAEETTPSSSLEEYWACLTPSEPDYSRTDTIIAHDEKTAIRVDAEPSKAVTNYDYESAIQGYRQELAESLGLTLPDMSEVLGRLDGEDMQSATLSEYTNYASEALSESYGLTIDYTPSSIDESSTPVDLESLDEHEIALLKSNVIQAVKSISMLPVELIDMTNVKGITFANILPRDDGFQAAAYASVAYDQMVIKYDSSLMRSTVNHELYHFLDYQMCNENVLHFQNDYGWKQLNPVADEEFYTYDHTNKSPSDPEHMSVETARYSGHDVGALNVVVAKDYGFVNNREDKATLGELILGNPADRDITTDERILRTLALSQSPLGDKMRYLLAQIHAENPAVLAWLVKSGDFVTFADEALVSERSFTLPEEILAQYRSTDLLDDIDLSDLRFE